MKYKLIEDLGADCPDCGTPCGLMEALLHENEILKAYTRELEALSSPEAVIAAKSRAFPRSPDLDPSEE